MKIKNTFNFSSFLLFLTSFIVVSCSSNDELQLDPIDTSLVKIESNVKCSPVSQWLIPTQQLSIKVSDIEMSAPNGVVLESISLIAKEGTKTKVIDNKPFSGNELEFKISLNDLQGRVNFSIIGKLIKKDSRDTEFLIADNIERIIFSEMPEFECRARLIVSIHSKSSSGEEYNDFFEVPSSDHFTITVPQNRLYWQPSVGEAKTIDVTLGSGATAWSPNTTFESKITKTAIGNSTGDSPTAKFTIPNIPGSLEALKLQLYVLTTYYGSWEDVTIEPYTLTNIFAIKEN